MKITFDFDKKYQGFENEASEIAQKIIQLTDDADWDKKVALVGGGDYGRGCEIINADIRRLLELSETLLSNYPVASDFRGKIVSAIHSAIECFGDGTILSKVPAKTVFSSDLLVKAFSLASEKNVPEMFEIDNNSSWAGTLPWPSSREQQNELIGIIENIDIDAAASIKRALAVNAESPADFYRLLSKQESGYFARNPGFFGANFERLKESMLDGYVFIPKLLEFFEYSEIEKLIAESDFDNRENLIAHAVQFGGKNSNELMEMYGVELNIVSYIERMKYTSCTTDIIDVLAEKLVAIDGKKQNKNAQILNAIRDLESPSQRIYLLETILEISPETITNFLLNHSNVNSIPRRELLSSAKFKKYREENIDKKDILSYFVDVTCKEFATDAADLVDEPNSQVALKAFAFMQSVGAYYRAYLRRNLEKFPILSRMKTNILAMPGEEYEGDQEFKAFCSIADAFYFGEDENVLSAVNDYLNINARENGKMVADFLQRTLSTKIYTSGFDTSKLVEFMDTHQSSLHVDLDSYNEFKTMSVNNNYNISEDQLLKIIQSGKFADFFENDLPQDKAEFASTKYISGLTLADKKILLKNTTPSVVSAVYKRSNSEEMNGYLFDYLYENGLSSDADFISNAASDIVGNVKLTRKNLVIHSPVLHLDHLTEKHAIDKIEFKLNFYKSQAKVFNWIDLKKNLMCHPEIRNDVLKFIDGLNADEIAVEGIQKLLRDVTVVLLESPSLLETWNLIRTSPNDMASFFDSASITHAQMKVDGIKQGNDLTGPSVNFDISF